MSQMEYCLNLEVFNCVCVCVTCIAQTKQLIIDIGYSQMVFGIEWL